MDQSAKKSEANSSPSLLASAPSFFERGKVTWRESMAGSTVLFPGLAIAACVVATLLWMRRRKRH